MTYVTSGAFRADVEAVTGNTIEPREQDGDENNPLAGFPEALRAELQALLDLDTWSLCALEVGDFCSVPALTDEPRDVVLEDWFDGDEAATDFVMQAIDIVHGSGFYIVIAPDGRMGLVCEDPYGLDHLSCTLEPFLRALVEAHRAVTTSGKAAAKAVLTAIVDERTAKLLLTFAGRLEPKPA